MMSKLLGLLLILPLFVWLYSWFLDYSLILNLITFGKGFAIILLAAIGVNFFQSDYKVIYVTKKQDEKENKNT
jgi:hypothetical protein